MLFERARDQRPCRAEVNFAVFGEEGREGGFFGEGPTEVVFGLEGFDLGGGISEDDISSECGGGYREMNGESESGMSLELSSFNSRGVWDAYLPLINIISIPWLVLFVR